MAKTDGRKGSKLEKRQPAARRKPEAMSGKRYSTLHWAKRCKAQRHNGGRNRGLYRSNGLAFCRGAEIPVNARTF